jgi:hypothetical protein
VLECFANGVLETATLQILVESFEGLDRLLIIAHVDPLRFGV